MKPHARMYHLGLDVDGVFANWNIAAGTMIRKASGRDLIPSPFRDPDVWEWPAAYGYTAAEETAMWQLIMLSPNFWELIPAYHGARTCLEAIDRQQRIGKLRTTFITSRPGRTAHAQTVRWLIEHGIDAPQVCIAEDAKAKGDLASALYLDALVDDHGPNLLQVKKLSRAKPIRFARVWNSAYSNFASVRTYGELCAWIGSELQDHALRYTLGSRPVKTAVDAAEKTT